MHSHKACDLSEWRCGLVPGISSWSRLVSKREDGILPSTYMAWHGSAGPGLQLVPQPLHHILLQQVPACLGRSSNKGLCSSPRASTTERLKLNYLSWTASRSWKRRKTTRYKTGSSRIGFHSRSHTAPALERQGAARTGVAVSSQSAPSFQVWRK